MNGAHAFSIADTPWLGPEAFTPEAQSLRFFPDGHRYEVGGRRRASVTEVLKGVGVSRDWSDIEPGVLDAARAVGVATHAATHYYDEGTLQRGTVHPLVEPRLQAWIDFRAAHGFTPVLLETPVDLPTLEISGTLDRAGFFAAFADADPSDLSTVDLKCGDPEDAGARWQTAAYTEALAQCLRANVLERLGGAMKLRLRPRYSVELTAEGRWRLHAYRDFLSDWRDYQHFVTTFRRQHVRRKEHV